MAILHKKCQGGGQLLLRKNGPRSVDTQDKKEFPYDGTSMYKGGYDTETAKEIYKPDNTGHLPTVDYRTGTWLKDKDYPTSWKELLSSQLNLGLNKLVGSPIQTLEGKLKYTKGYE